MGDFLSFLVFAGLFLFMMRYGCGGHGRTTHHHRNEGVNHIDPVCGKMVIQTEGYGMMYRKKLYRFCSRECLSSFEHDPDACIARLTGNRVRL